MATTRTLISNKGLISRLADAAVGRFLIACAGTDVDHVAVADGADDVPLGIIVDGCGAAEEPLAIALLGKGETKVVALSGTCAVDDWLVPAVDGSGKARKLPTAPGTYCVIGRAREIGANGQEIAFTDVIPFAVTVQAHIVDAAATATAPAAATYAAPAGGATQDAEGRASLAQLATDVGTIRTRQGTIVTELVAAVAKINAILVALESATPAVVKTS